MVKEDRKYKDVFFNPLTPLSFLKRSELAFPDKEAVVYRDKRYTWREFGERVYRLAHALQERGIRKDDRVAMLCRNNNVMLESFYGIGISGGVNVPINVRLAPKEVAYILNRSESKILILDHGYASTIRSMEKLETVDEIINVPDPDEGLDEEILGEEYEEALRRSSKEPIDVPVKDELDMLSISYTSGTTGPPKGCVYTHRGAYLNALGEALEGKMSSESANLWTLPMFHANGWCFVWAVTAVGAKHVCLDAVRGKEMYELIEDEDVTNMSGAPTVYLILCDYMRENNLKFSHKIIGMIAGSAPSPKIIRDSEEIGVDIVHVYGLTESYGPHTICEWHSEWNSLDERERAELKARQGVPYSPWFPVKVVDEEMNEVPHDGKTEGEIVMQGNNLMMWYFKDHERTEKAFKGGCFHTGDAAIVHPDGYIEIMDRIKDIIISGGENIASIEIENVIMEHPSVRDVAVFSKPDERWGEVPKALVELKRDEEATEEEIIKWCRDRMAHFKSPKEVEFGEIPWTSTGKKMKYVLKRREQEKMVGGYHDHK